MRFAGLLVLAAALGAAELLPGWPVALPDFRAPPPAWRQEGGALVALAPDGRELRREPLRPGSLVWAGDGGALIADGDGLRGLDPRGGSGALPPLPRDVVPLGVDRGTASFAQGRSGWRLDRGPGALPQRIALPDEPLGPALVAGGESLWLTMLHLVHHDGATTTAHRHGLAAGRGWRLGRDAAGAPLVLAPDGRAWALPPWQPGPDDERLGRPIAPAADASREVRLREALRRHDWTAARTLAIGTAEHAALALYAGWPVPPGAADLAPIPRDPADTALPEAGWSGGAAPRARPAPQSDGPPAGIDRDRPLADADEPWDEDEAPQRTVDGLVVGQQAWQLVDDGERVTATCRDGAGLRWFSRWLPEPDLGAPAHFLDLRPGRLLVGAGDARLLILDAGNGVVLCDVRPQRVPVLPGRTWPRGDGAVVLHPPGRDDHLGWLSAPGREQDETLPAPARWLMVLPDGEVWLALADGRCLAGSAPGAWRPLALPEGLRLARAPRPVAGGVAAEGRRWPWRR